MIVLLNSLPIHSVNHKHRQKESRCMSENMFMQVVWFYGNYGSFVDMNIYFVVLKFADFVDSFKLK